MNFYKSLITPFKNFEYKGNLDYSGFSFEKYYPLLGIKTCEVDFEAYREEDETLMAYAYIKATLLIADSRDLTPFEYPLEIETDFQILNSIEEEGEGYIYKENAIPLEELILLIVKGEIPISPHKEETPLPESGEGYSFVDEDNQSDDKERVIFEEERKEEES